MKKIKNKIKNHNDLKIQIEKWKSDNKQIVFTNGCFDLLHYGHIHYLANAKKKGDFLVVALNSSDSISQIKGDHRPINDDLTRTNLMASLEFVDAVTIFHKETPYELIKLIQPNVLVKGGDWDVKEIVGSDIVISLGGRVMFLPFIDGYSTTGIEEKIKKQALNEFNKENKN